MEAEVKVGQVCIVGRIAEKSCETFNMRQRYSFEVTTEAQYPSTFKVTTLDASVYGTKGADIGALVRVTAFVNGWKKTDYKDAQGTLHAFKFPRYEVGFRIAEIEVLEPVQAAPSLPVDDAGADDFPY